MMIPSFLFSNSYHFFKIIIIIITIIIILLLPTYFSLGGKANKQTIY